ncbi:MAG: ABC transporter transmembrane domain-containing protein, partial [Candidatus Thorarchaeota archaeon]
MAMRRGPTALASEKRHRSRSLRTLLGSMFHYLGRFRKLIVFAAIFSIIAVIFRTLDPLILAQGIDLVLMPGSALFGVFFLGGLYLIFRLISWVLSSLYTWILSGAQAGFVRSLQQDVYNKLIGADLSYHQSKQSGDITSRVTTDTDNLAVGIQIVIDFASQLLLLFTTFTLMWLASPLVALTALIVVPVVILIVVLFGTVGQRT